MNPPISYVNLSANAKEGALLTSYTQQSLEAAPMEFYAGDNTPKGFAFLLPSYDVSAPYPYFFQDPAGFAFEVKVGSLGQQPDGGSYTLTGTLGVTTAAIAYNAIAATTVQTAIRTITGMGAATVTGSPGGPYYVDSQAAANPTLDLSSNSSGLAPDGSEAIVVKTQTSNSLLTNRWTITLVRAFLVFNDAWNPLEPVSVATNILQPGIAGDQSLVVAVTWNPDAYGGTVTFTITKPDSTTGTVTFAYNADGPTIDQIIQTFSAEDAPVTSTVKNDSGNYTITAIGTWENDAVLAIDYETDNLLVPVGYQAPLMVSVAAADALFAGTTDDTVNVIVVFKLSAVVGQPGTVVQTDGILVKTFPIGGNAGTGAPSFLTTSTGVSFLSVVTGYTGGGSTKLDGVATTGFNSLALVEFIHATDGARQFQFVNPNATATLAGVVIEPLDNSAARWLSRM